jgi:hypothetical protein
LAGRQLQELGLPDEGVVVLGVEREDGTYTGAPRGATAIEEGDTLLIYARIDTVRDLDDRPKGPEGQRRHYEQASEQQERERRMVDDNLVHSRVDKRCNDPAASTHQERTGHAAASDERKPMPPG